MSLTDEQREVEPASDGDVRARSYAVGQRLLGRYVVDGRLSSGAHGSVFRGRDQRTQRPVALKVEHHDLDAIDRARFEQEAQILGRISHPNVVRVLDAGRAEDGAALVVMELLEGPTLRALLESRGGWLAWREAVAIGAGLLRGLSAAHDAGVIHRDVKPSNIVVVQGDEGPVAKLIDFGVAKDGRDDGFVALTVEGEVLGTLNYMAPEQLTGEAALPQADIYAAAVTLYECLTGALPYQGKGMRSAMAKVCGTPPDPLRPPTGAELWPPRLSALVLQALSTEPSQRPSSARAFAEQLERCGEDVAAPLALAGEAPARPTARASVEFVAFALPEGSLSKPENLAFVSELLRGTARPFIVGPDALGALLLRGGTGESANVVEAITRGVRARFGEVIVARERLDAGEAALSERSVSDAAGRLARRLSRPPSGE
ncbi:MAG: serine/threonine-protein kinase [Polyangiales bacterium]